MNSVWKHKFIVWTESFRATDLQKPKGFMIKAFPAGEQVTLNTIDVISWPQEEIHVLRATNDVLYLILLFTFLSLNAHLHFAGAAT